MSYEAAVSRTSPEVLPGSQAVREPTLCGARVRHTRQLTGGYYVIEAQLDGVAPGTSPLADVQPGRFIMLRGEWGRELLNPRAFSILTADQVDSELFGGGAVIVHMAHRGHAIGIVRGGTEGGFEIGFGALRARRRPRPVAPPRHLRPSASRRRGRAAPRRAGGR